MKHLASHKIIGLLSLAFLLWSLPQASAQRARTGFYGDWLMKMQFNERPIESILTFSRDADGNRTAHWISFMGMTELKDVQIEANKLQFARINRFRDSEFTSKFTGELKEGKISGIFSSDRGEMTVEGQRLPRMPRIAGTYAMKVSVGDRVYDATLTVSADQDGQLQAQWRSSRGEDEVTQVAYENRMLSFKRKSSNPDRSFTTTFTGTLSSNSLSGVFSMDTREVKAEGTRVGGALIGRWLLDLTSERGTRQQMLRVNPDFSGLYGATKIEKVQLNDDQVSFKITLRFGEREFEIEFAGQLEEAGLVGELTTSRGTQKVTGKKIVRRRGRN